MLTVLQVKTAEQIETARTLFREYEAWLGMDLCFQGFDGEVRDLPGKYVPPDGRLFLAYLYGEAVGCVAMRKLEEGICEMKRLYLRKTARGVGAGNQLIEELIGEARREGYKKMRLDTYPPKMARALQIYRAHGFCEIPPYYHNPHGGTLFLELSL